jgi:hypothetical protein
MLRVTAGSESVMVPLSFDPDCCQVRVNVPWEAPLYCPDHVPESPPVATAVVDACALLVAVEIGGVVVGGVVLLQPTAITASSDMTAVSSRPDDRGEGCIARSRRPGRADARGITRVRGINGASFFMSGCGNITLHGYFSARPRVRLWLHDCCPFYASRHPCERCLET